MSIGSRVLSPHTAELQSAPVQPDSLTCKLCYILIEFGVQCAELEDSICGHESLDGSGFDFQRAGAFVEEPGGGTL